MIWGSFVCGFATIGAALILESLKEVAALITGACKECENARIELAPNWSYGAVLEVEPK